MLHDTTFLAISTLSFAATERVSFRAESSHSASHRTPMHAKTRLPVCSPIRSPFRVYTHMTAATIACPEAVRFSLAYPSHIAAVLTAVRILTTACNRSRRSWESFLPKLWSTLRVRACSLPRTDVLVGFPPFLYASCPSIVAQRNCCMVGVR
jgi:hypothetical protein